MIPSLKTSASLVCLLIAAPLTSGTVPGVRGQSPAAGGSGARATVTASSICGKNDSYESLIAEYSKPSAQTFPFATEPSGSDPIELAITSTLIDERPVDAWQASDPNFCIWHTFLVGATVSTTGVAWSFAHDDGGSRGGGGGKLDPDVFARLEKLMDDLPDDGHRLPEPSRRVFVRDARDDIVRLYDRAHLPGEILEMIRLTGARIQVIAPAFQPDKVWTGEETQSLGLPLEKAPHFDSSSLSSDGSIGAAHDFVTKTITVYKVTPGSGNRWPANQDDIIRVVDEFWQPPVYGGYAVASAFSPDDRYLLVSWGRRIGALLYDTSTWKPVTDPHLFPQKLKEYLPSADWSLGVAVTDTGETLIWDQEAHRVLSKLAGLGEFEPAPVITDRNGKRVYDTPSAEIQSAAFSPDGTRVAIYSGPDIVTKLRLSVWDVESGEMLHELWPVEWLGYPNGNPVWWNGGRWLIAPYSSQFSGGGLGLWDVETGRFLGTLDRSECDARETPIASGAKLLQTCFTGKAPDRRIPDDKVLEWNVDSLAKQLARFNSN